MAAIGQTSFSSPGGLPQIHIDPQLGIVHPALASALAYWRSRAGDAMPRRTDIDPVEMRHFLPHIGLADLSPGPDGKVHYFVRVAGAEVENVFGPLTGRYLHDVLPAMLLPRWEFIFGSTIRARAPLRFVSRVAHEGKLHLAFEALVAPLSEDRVNVTMLLGAFTVWAGRDAPPAIESIL